MTRIPKKVQDRLSKEVRVFQRVLERARSRDVSESDTSRRGCSETGAAPRLLAAQGRCSLNHEPGFHLSFDQ